MRTPITYYGGKQQMLKYILPEIPPHRIYCEPFFGGGAVFFAKNKSYLEVINDRNDRLMCFYETLRGNFDELNELIENTLHSEAMHKYAKDVYNERVSASRLEMAWAVWVITNMSFSASARGGWKWCNGGSGSHSGVFISKKTDEFKNLRERLRNVQIECTDALEIIQKRDTEETFFYIDPPYPGACQQHYRGYSMKEFIKLLEILPGIKGKFLLSNFSSQALKWYSEKYRWSTQKFTMSMRVANFNSPRTKTEILTKNYSIRKDLFNQ